jgi:hypothetical protein
MSSLLCRVREAAGADGFDVAHVDDETILLRRRAALEVVIEEDTAAVTIFWIKLKTRRIEFALSVQWADADEDSPLSRGALIAALHDDDLEALSSHFDSGVYRPVRIAGQEPCIRVSAARGTESAKGILLDGFAIEFTEPEWGALRESMLRRLVTQ